MICAFCDETFEPDDRDHLPAFCSLDCEAGAEVAAARITLAVFVRFVRANPHLEDDCPVFAGALEAYRASVREMLGLA